jgi:hypothetical protein
MILLTKLVLGKEFKCSTELGILAEGSSMMPLLSRKAFKIVKPTTPLFSG